MPLIATHLNPVADTGRQALGFWMKIEASADQILVFVTYECLANIDPSQPRDLFAAEETFIKSRNVIEAAASKKFDSEGVENETQEGKSILTVYSSDL